MSLSQTETLRENIWRSATGDRSRNQHPETEIRIPCNFTVGLVAAWTDNMELQAARKHKAHQDFSSQELEQWINNKRWEDGPPILIDLFEAIPRQQMPDFPFCSSYSSFWNCTWATRLSWAR